MSERLNDVASRLRSEDAEIRRQAVRDVPGASVEGALELLIRTLGDDNWRVRKEAAARVSAWPEAGAAITMLLAALREDEDVGCRNAVVEALSAIGRPAVAPILSELAAGGEHRKFLVDTLGAIGEGEATSMLIRVLSDEDPNLRVAAAEGLRHIGGAEAKAALRSCLHSADRSLRLAALDGLAMLQAIVPIAEIAGSLEDPLLRKSAFRLLGWSGDPAAATALIAALSGDARAVHSAATVALATLIRNAEDPAGEIARAVAAIDAETQLNVVGVLASDDEVRRRAAATILGASGAAEFANTLARALVDPSMAEACAAALAELGQDAVGPILEVAGDAEIELRADLFDLLGQLQLGGRDVDAALLAGLDDEEPVAAAAARSLGLLAVGSGGARLGQALGDADRPEVASAAATALGRLGALGVVPAAAGWLRELGMASAVGEVRAASSLALAETGAPEAEAALHALLDDEEPYVRLAVIRALGAVGAYERLRARLTDETDAEIVAAIRAELDDADA
ncbi:MAG TPA: HEAT repeat domain-containing protein [Kofleriaceae bacterium]|nr:HEAT repeat domain-containing protein [Kofleriaceae bacterium]